MNGKQGIYFICALIFSALALGACGGGRSGGESGNDPNREVTAGTITLTITNTDAKPQFNWSGGASKIKVWSPNNRDSSWEIECPRHGETPDCIFPPVNYSDLIEGITVNVDAKPLIPGDTYYFQITRSDGSYGTHSFTH